MQLKVKPIVNGLFHATVTHQKLQGIAVGYTKDEATQNALGWLKRGIEATGTKNDQPETSIQGFLKDQPGKN